MRAALPALVTALRASGAAVAVFLFAAHDTLAADGAATFEVRVNATDGRKPPEIGLCRAEESGSVASVVCIPNPTPEPTDTVAANPGRRLFFTNVRFYISGTGNWLGAIDDSMGLGTVTSWRVIRVANRDYLEMMVGW
jgi:hypothetical protein